MRKKRRQKGGRRGIYGSINHCAQTGPRLHALQNCEKKKNGRQDRGENQMEGIRWLRIRQEAASRAEGAVGGRLHDIDQ